MTLKQLKMNMVSQVMCVCLCVFVCVSVSPVIPLKILHSVETPCSLCVLKQFACMRSLYFPHLSHAFTHQSRSLARQL